MCFLLLPLLIQKITYYKYSSAKCRILQNCFHLIMYYKNSITVYTYFPYSFLLHRVTLHPGVRHFF